jgi:hypothetical protein
MKHENGYYHLLGYTVIYFFLNGFLLPEGLLFTTLLTPVMLYFLYKNRTVSPSPFWLLLLLIPVPFHVLHGVNSFAYMVSSVLILTAVIFLFTVSTLYRKYASGIPDLFKSILIINTLLTGVALVTLPVAPVRDWLWYTVPVSAGVEALPRLKLLTYEASYYALIMVPVFLFFLYRVMFGKQKHALIAALACILPLVLSLSFGVIGAMVIAWLITLVFYWKYLPKQFRQISLYSVILLVGVVLVMLVTWRENPVFIRVENIFTGKDTSAMGRLVYSFMFAKELAFGNNWMFGTGPGQIKILAHDLIVNHYHYHGAIAETVRIPNSMAEMLATYGIYGVTVKVLLELYFFVKKRICSNLFSVTLFLFLFIYQFTGSFLVNVAELGAWALIFGARFREFDISYGQPGKEQVP